MKKGGKKGKNRPSGGDAPGYSFAYDLEQPAHSVSLPFEHDGFESDGLSGVAKHPTRPLLACIIDTDGLVAFCDSATLGVTAVARFVDQEEDDVDFEDCAWVRDDVLWILRSDGTLFEVGVHADLTVELLRRVETRLTHRDNCEGLCFDEPTNSLWIACKEESRERHVYALSLETEALAPLFSLDWDAVEEVYGASVKKLNPSGIAIHPRTRDIFVISTSGQGRGDI